MSGGQAEDLPEAQKTHEIRLEAESSVPTTAGTEHSFMDKRYEEGDLECSRMYTHRNKQLLEPVSLTPSTA